MTKIAEFGLLAIPSLLLYLDRTNTSPLLPTFWYLIISGTGFIYTVGQILQDNSNFRRVTVILNYRH